MLKKTGMVNLHNLSVQAEESASIFVPLPQDGLQNHMHSLKNIRFHILTADC